MKRATTMTMTTASKLRAAPSLQGFPPALLAHHFGLVCERHHAARGWFPETEAEAGRTLAYALKHIKRIERNVGQLERDY